MARIMCSQKLWRRLGHSGRPPLQVAEPLIHGVCLGSWAAKVCKIDRRDVVIALNERTYLTLLFPMSPWRRFRENFALALAHVLEDLALPPDVVRSEAAAIEFVPLARLSHRSMAGTLNDLKFHSAIELEYHRDLRKAQLALNDMPHVNRDPCVPIDAVNQLFEAAPDTRSFAAH